MKEHITRGIICLQDEYQFVYRIAAITYTIWEDGSFAYVFTPNYTVIDMLPANLFQGIPGLDLSARKENYIRKNIIPVFISERAPGENRQDLWQLLEPHQMAYLNQLEWLIKTDTVYSGDLLYVKAYNSSDDKQTIRMDSVRTLGKRSVQILRRLLESLCFGHDIVTRAFHIDDATRGLYYPLLMELYAQEKAYLKKRQSTGIQQAALQGRYSGRKPLPIDDTKLHEVLSDYQKGRISLPNAMKNLGVSQSTFYRRYRKWLNQENSQ